MSPDWSDKPEEVPYSVLTDPQSLNLYSYVRNHPIMSVDADGHCDGGTWWCDSWHKVKDAVVESAKFTKELYTQHPGDRFSVQSSQEFHSTGDPGKMAMMSSLGLLAAQQDMQVATDQAIDDAINSENEEEAPILPGSFSVIDWSGYPEGVPQPAGPFRLLEGEEYNAARAAANSANREIRQANPAAYSGMEIHEIHPVKFGGSPTNPANKVAVSKAVHPKITGWWNSLMNALK